MSPIIFCGVAFVVIQQPGSVPAQLPVLFVYALAGVAAMTTLALPLLRRVLLPPIPGESVGPVDGAPAPQNLWSRYQTGNIICWALCESIGIYGLMLTIMSHDIRYAAGFTGLSILNMALYRPRGDQMRTRYWVPARAASAPLATRLRFPPA